MSSSYFNYNQNGKATRIRGKEIVNSLLPTYDQEPEMVAEDDTLSKEIEIDKLMALISLSFKKIYKPANNTSKLHQTPVDQIKIILQELIEELEQADWRDHTDDKHEDQELETHYLYMAQIQEVTSDAADNSGPIFDVKPLQKVQNDNDNYNVFSNDSEHHEKPKSVNDTYPDEQGDTNIPTNSFGMSNNRG
nr:hypothetical protein [Tanacetum cinerariifolium]